MKITNDREAIAHLMDVLREMESIDCPCPFCLMPKVDKDGLVRSADTRHRSDCSIRNVHLSVRAYLHSR